MPSGASENANVVFEVHEICEQLPIAAIKGHLKI